MDRSSALHATCQLSLLYEKCMKMQCSLSLVERIAYCIISLYLCAAVFLLSSLLLCVTCSPVFHPMFMAMCLSVSVEDLPGLSSSCPWVFEPGWPDLVVANWRAEQTAWGVSVWGSNCRHHWDRRKTKTWRAERNSKRTGTKQQWFKDRANQCFEKHWYNKKMWRICCCPDLLWVKWKQNIKDRWETAKKSFSRLTG